MLDVSTADTAQEINSDASWDEWVARTQDFLRQPAVWQRVEAVASALLERTTLNSEQLIAVIRERVEPYHVTPATVNPDYRPYIW